MDRVEVTFRNMKTSDSLEQDIRERAGKLETYCPDIVSCRVLVGIPHKHHEQGNRFEVHINVAVPGEEIAVSHPPQVSERDVRLVVRDAFAAAKRQVQDYARRKRLAVKAHTAKVTVART
jgi:ribosome-associated translation inhibitor RaiA